MPLVFGQRRQMLDRIIKPLPVAALALEQRFQAGHQLVIGGLRAERGVVGARYPLVEPAPAGRIGALAGAQLRIALTELAHDGGLGL